MCMDKRRFSVIEVQIVNKLLHCGSAKSRSGNRRGLDDLQRRLIQRQAAGCGGVVWICNGQNPIPDGIWQQRYAQKTQCRKKRNEPRPPQNTITAMAQAPPPSWPGSKSCPKATTPTRNTPPAMKRERGASGAKDKRQRQREAAKSALQQRYWGYRKRVYPPRHPAFTFKSHTTH